MGHCGHITPLTAWPCSSVRFTVGHYVRKNCHLLEEWELELFQVMELREDIVFKERKKSDTLEM